MSRSSFRYIADEQFLAVCNVSIVNGPGYSMDASDFTTVPGRQHGSHACFPQKARRIGDTTDFGWCSGKSRN